MEVSILNLEGHVIITKHFNDVTELREQCDISKFASGTLHDVH